MSNIRKRIGLAVAARVMQIVTHYIHYWKPLFFTSLAKTSINLRACWKKKRARALIVQAQKFSVQESQQILGGISSSSGPMVAERQATAYYPWEHWALQILPAPSFCARRHASQFHRYFLACKRSGWQCCAPTSDTNRRGRGLDWICLLAPFSKAEGLSPSQNERAEKEAAPAVLKTFCHRRPCTLRKWSKRFGPSARMTNK